MKELSRRARDLRPSVTLELAARARESAARGRPVLDMTVGEPDLPTPAPVVEAAHAALRAGHFKYTPTPGIVALRQAVARAASHRLHLDVRASQIVVSNGCKQAIFNALATATDPGDTVCVLRPYWVSYIEAARSLGCKIVEVDCPAATGFRPDLGQLAAVLRQGVRLIVLNSPCNPTGAAWSSLDFAPLLELIAAHDTWILSDEIYEDIVYRAEGHVSPLHVRPDLADRCCVVSGLSKSFAMTGWRVGWSIAPEPWSTAMSALQGHLTSNINSIAQHAAVAALAQPELIEPLSRTFARRCRRVIERAAKLAGTSFVAPEGTFYLYLNVAEQLGPKRPTADIDAHARWLLDDYDLAVIPGSAFGESEHLRLSFACSDEVIEAAFDRLELAYGSRGR